MKRKKEKECRVMKKQAEKCLCLMRKLIWTPSGAGALHHVISHPCFDIMKEPGGLPRFPSTFSLST